jgi:hypothetical protein
MTKSYRTPTLEEIKEGLVCEILDEEALSKAFNHEFELKALRLGYNKIKPFFKPHTLTKLQAEMYHLNPNHVKGNIRVENKNENYTSFLDGAINGNNGY